MPLFDFCTGDDASTGEGDVIGALALVTTVNRMAVRDQSKLTPLVQRVASEISARLV
jgi:DNA-binding IclR family transcriptional regulator